MIVDLLHNKIVKETITEAFEKSVNDSLIPKLYALYSTSLEGVQMYEDYLNDDFKKDGYWYYPLTVLIAGINAVIWIKWDVSDPSKFENGNPYAYSGEGIDFLIADDVPIAFKNALDGRASYFEGGCVKTNVATDAPSAAILIGKYSQTFIDEMTRQITRVIEKACGVSGIEDSSIELDFVFAPNTYMEHTSENVTYRRLLISAKGCSPRDFWIKWTRLNSSVAFSVKDNVSEEDIVFELGEDVPHKTREKEYRFLVYGNSEKYRVAMGRKNITEWRELIKRAVKRGELNKTTTELEKDAHVAEVSDKLSEILEKYGMAIPTAPETEVKGSADIANEALRLAVLGDVPEADVVPAEKSSAESVAEALDGENETELEVSLEAEDVTEEEAETEEDTEKETVSVKEKEAEDSENGVFSFAGIEISDEASAADNDDDFDFDKEHEQFEMAIPEAKEPSFADILADFMPDEEDEEDEVLARIEEPVSIADVEETESAVYEIDKPIGVQEDISEEYGDETENTEEAEDDVDAAELEDATVAMDDEDFDTAEAIDDSKISEAEELPVSEEEAETEDIPAVDIEEIKRELEAEYIEKLAALTAELDTARAEILDAKGAAADAEAAAEKARKDADKYFLATEKADNALNAERLAAADLRAEIEKQKFAIEQVRKLIDEAANARMLAEAETARIRAEYEELKRENVGLVEAARVAEEACAAAEERSRACEEKLEEQIELFEKEKIRQKNLFAQAAMQAKEERDRTEAELAEAEALRRIEEARLETLRLEEEQRIRSEAEALKERERIEAEALRRMQEAEDRKRSIEQRAHEARMIMEERARAAAEARAAASPEYARVVPPSYVPESAPVAEAAQSGYEEPSAYTSAPESYVPEAEVVPEPVPEVTPKPVVNYTYTSKIVRLLFKRAMDPNITARVHELISEALTESGKSDIYIKVKASVADNSTVVLNFVEFPEEEMQLLVNIINYLGNSDLGIYKIILE